MRQLGLKVLVAACVVFAVFLGTAAPGRAANLSGSGLATPSTVPAGSSTLLTVVVTPSDSPPSTNILVTVNTTRSAACPPCSCVTTARTATSRPETTSSAAL